LLSAILADGINLGLNRTADAIRGVSYRHLALAHDCISGRRAIRRLSLG
jgi:Tn3 transposase DDE domain